MYPWFSNWLFVYNTCNEITMLIEVSSCYMKNVNENDVLIPNVNVNMSELYFTYQCN